MKKDAVLPDIIVSADLEVFEDARIFSKLEPDLYPCHDWISFKDSTALELVERQCITYYLLYPFRWCILRPILMIVKTKKWMKFIRWPLEASTIPQEKPLQKPFGIVTEKKLPNMFCVTAS